LIIHSHWVSKDVDGDVDECLTGDDLSMALQKAMILTTIIVIVKETATTLTPSSLSAPLAILTNPSEGLLDPQYVYHAALCTQHELLHAVGHTLPDACCPAYPIDS